MTKILVLCTGNSCRSQIAEGWLKQFFKGKAEVYSAGLETHGVNPKAIKVMAEVKVDISNHTSDNLEKYLKIEFDHIITVCDNAQENCPVFPGKANRLHYNFPDPAKATGTDEAILDEFRKVRDMIRDYCENFVESI
jgi:arsenate reductase